MSNYNRVTVWTNGQNLTATDLNAEFDAIKAVINGGLDASNFSSLLAVQSTFFIHAGDDRFQTGGLSNAQLVAAAVAEAIAGDIKLVYIPRTMFGYVEDAEYGTIPGNSSIMRIREGQMGAGHDPVAYGAKPDDVGVDNQPAFMAARVAAENSDLGLNPGGTWVEVTMKGAYNLDTNFVIGADHGFIEYRGVSYTGAGTITSPNVDDTDKNGLIPWEGLLHRLYTDNTDQVVGASSTETVIFDIPYDPAEYLLVHWRLEIEEDGGNVNVPTFGLSKGVTLTGITTNLDVEIISSGVSTGGEYTIAMDVTNNDGGNPHTANITLTAYLLKLTAEL